MASLNKLNSIQYLRAAAALLVVYCHSIDIQKNFGDLRQSHFFYLENFGAIGVDIFFVISGFIISYISQTQSGANAAIEFSKKRWLRVAPVYYVASFMLMLVFLYSGAGFLNKQSIIKTLTIVPLLDSGTEAWSSIIAIGWTLSFEFLFYFLFAIAIASKAKRKDLFLISAVGTLVVAGMLFPERQQIQWSFLTNPVSLEFCFGILLSMLYKSDVLVPQSLSWFFIATGIFLMVCLIVFGYGDVADSGKTIDSSNSFIRVLLWGVPSAILSLGFIFLEKVSIRNYFSNRFVLLIGNASYSIYLIHITIFVLIAAFIKRVSFMKTIAFEYGDALLFFNISFAVICGCLFHLGIEKPLLRKFGKHL
jgi:exopolysaccharide production protein ExoZ